MNKAQLIDAVSQVSGLSKADAQRAVDGTFDSITKALSQGDSVVVVGFGTFAVKKRAARTGRDPRTGGSLQIPAATVANFKPGKSLKDSVNGGEVLETEKQA